MSLNLANLYKLISLFVFLSELPLTQLKLKYLKVWILNLLFGIDKIKIWHMVTFRVGNN